MSNADYASKLGDVFLCIFAAARSWKRKKKLAKEFFSTLQKDTAMEETIVERKHLCDDVFDPFSVLWIMDLEGGKLNYEAIGLLRQLPGLKSQCLQHTT
jgi:hypothetical protein